MKVLNIHEREFEADPIQIGALIDTLASKEDRLWPKHVWPRMEFDRSLGVGAKGGHGPIRYFVEEYTPSKSIKFHFQHMPQDNRLFRAAHNFVTMKTIKAFRASETKFD